MQFFVGVLSALRLCVSTFGFLSGPLSEIIDGLRSRRFGPAGPPFDQLANTQKRSHAKPQNKQSHKNLTSRSTPLPRPPHPASGHPLAACGATGTRIGADERIRCVFPSLFADLHLVLGAAQGILGSPRELRETTRAAAREDEREPRLYEQAVQPRRPVTSRLEALGCAAGTTSDRRGWPGSITSGLSDSPPRAWVHRYYDVGAPSGPQRRRHCQSVPA